MVELTTIKVERPIVDWLNSLKGLLEWKVGKRYTLNNALAAIFTDFDVRYAISEGCLDESDEKQINDYLRRRLKQFWSESKPPDVKWGSRPDFFSTK